MPKNNASDGTEKKKKPSIVLKLLIFLVLAAVLCCGSVFAYIKFSEKKDIVVENIHNIETNTYNLKPSDSGSFAKMSIGLAYQDDEVLKAIEKDIAVIKDTIILTLSDKSGDELLSSDSKNKLKEELIEKINKNLNKYNGNLEGKGLTNIYFDNFVISN